MKFGYITDMHFRSAVPGSSELQVRKCRDMEPVLKQYISWFQQEKVDCIICTGDMVDVPDHPETITDLRTLKELFIASGIRTIVLPGNHDPAPENFYTVFNRPKRLTRCGNVAIITLCNDVPATGQEYSRRADSELEQMQKYLAELSGDIEHTLILQHYVVYPAIGAEYPYNYQNAYQIQCVMEQTRQPITAICGHYHKGFDLRYHNGVSYFCGKALCEGVFPGYILDVDGNNIRIQEEAYTNILSDES